MANGWDATYRWLNGAFRASLAGRLYHSRTNGVASCLRRLLERVAAWNRDSRVRPLDGCRLPGHPLIVGHPPAGRRIRGFPVQRALLSCARALRARVIVLRASATDRDLAEDHAPSHPESPDDRDGVQRSRARAGGRGGGGGGRADRDSEQLGRRSTSRARTRANVRLHRNA